MPDSPRRPSQPSRSSRNHLRAGGQHRAHLDSWVGELFTDEYLDDTCAQLAAAAQPDTNQQAQERQLRDRIRQLDQELDSYRAIVRTEPEAASAVGRWIAEANQERRRLEALLGRTPTTRITAEDIKAIVASLQNITATLAAADPADKAKVYAEMGIDITYHREAGSSSSPGRV